jgi:O-antigen/teichoic acid export membrane protein
MGLKKIANRIGLDKAILFTSSTSIIGAIGGLGSIILVVKYLTGFEQGFYYTFGSIAAIQVFFELGLNNIITQYVAHENSNLKWENDIQFTGEAKFKSRLSSLLHFSVKWYSSFALLLLFFLIVFFIEYFSNVIPSNIKKNSRSIGIHIRKKNAKKWPIKLCIILRSAQARPRCD